MRGSPRWNHKAPNLSLLKQTLLTRHQAGDIPSKPGPGLGGDAAGAPEQGLVTHDSRAHLPKHGHARLINVLLPQHRPARPKKRAGVQDAAWRVLVPGARGYASHPQQA